ncbi:SRPBCC family protein [uncultured Aquimarina sp.]|uniref:SRPBCC family protein n=1 Tax=uncultured Aquimarina sp. TaxID=575652 RepID=UPI002606A04D|nr:SRPBCC family protein [uncultured Aquimarina sp.]
MDKKLTLIIIVAFTLLVIACTKGFDKEKVVDKTEKVIENIKILELETNNHSIYTSIVINAPSNEVWQVMTDFNTMPNWSSTLKKISGNLTNEGRVDVTYSIDEKVRIIPHNFIYSENEHYGWSDTIQVLPGIIDRHLFRIESIDSIHTKFIQSDEFKGQNKNINTVNLARYVLPSYLIFNRELKKEVESRLQNSKK